MLKQNKDNILYLHNGSKQLPSSSLWTICLKETENPQEAKASNLWLRVSGHMLILTAQHCVPRAVIGFVLAGKGYVA